MARKTRKVESLGAAMRGLVKELVNDLRAQAEASPAVKAALAARGRGSSPVEALERELAQIGAMWALTAVFARYLEDNDFLPARYLAGPGLKLAEAREQQRKFFHDQPTLSDTDYLLWVFEELGKTDAGEIFRAEQNALHRLRLSGDMAARLLAFFREVDPDTQQLRFAFKADEGQQDSTRALGDLYQELSDEAKEEYALCQTPDFVASFLLDQTLTPALDEHGVEAVTVLDPTCGSGHLLLDALRRLVRERRRALPGEEAAARVRAALEAVYGVDINPFAAQIARFRLQIEAMRAADMRSWVSAPALPLHVAAGDSLLGPRHPRTEGAWAAAQGARDVDDELSEEAAAILGRQYHVVVGNPPYITARDPQKRELYRARYRSCSGKYALVCPFVERFFELAQGERYAGAPPLLRQGDAGATAGRGRAGYVAMIVANSFMKRSFGKKLVEEVIPELDLTRVVDTSGAYIPGHGTPTVILVGQNQAPRQARVRAVLGIRGEPSTPEVASEGLVWTSIMEGLDQPGYEDAYVSVADVSRKKLSQHPWSLQGGGAQEVRATIERAPRVLDGKEYNVGIVSFTLEDDVFIQPSAFLARRGALDPAQARPYVIGEAIRDWSIGALDLGIFPYDEDIQIIQDEHKVKARRLMWPYRATLSSNKMFGGVSKVESGLKWYEYGRLTSDRLKTPLTITFAFVATHNHFVLDRGGKVFKQSAPVIKLPPGATEDDHLGLLGLLNSSTACFWMKQVFYPKGGDKTGDGGRRAVESWHDRIEHDGTKLRGFPVPLERPLELGRRLDALGQAMAALDPGAVIGEAGGDDPGLGGLDAARAREEVIWGAMVALQEELDWGCYGLYGLVEGAPVAGEGRWEALPEVRPGERAFEIVLARKVSAGEVETSWFARHEIAPLEEAPSSWPAWYRALVEARIALIEGGGAVGLIERPEYKRRWQRRPWGEREGEALRRWALARLESARYWPRGDGEARLRRVNELCIEALRDDALCAVAARLSQDVEALVRSLLEGESAPFLPSQRYKGVGLEKRRAWERVWAQQRAEDRGEAVEVEAPPKYTAADFARNEVYRLRGKLDVAREAFVSYPGCEGEGGGALYLWAGYDHRAQAVAVANAHGRAKKDVLGVEGERRLLAGLLELEPWVSQWHPEEDEAFGEPLGPWLRSYVEGEAPGVGGLGEVEAARWGQEVAR